MFGALLRELRLRLGLSQEALADRAGLSARGISDNERGKRGPRAATLQLLANALDLTGEERANFIACGLDLASSASDTAQHTQHNLPYPLTPLLGREREVSALVELVNREDVRLVTITGPGGIGKTRLSIAVAHALLETATEAFPDGIWQVPLARITAPVLVVPTIAQTLGLSEGGALPLPAVLRGYLRNRRLLLVLDNFEQVLDAGRAIGDLLIACPGVTVLVTSRAALHVRGERVIGLAPLALPDPDHLPPLERLSAYAALELFTERAQSVQSDFTLTSSNGPDVAAICARLDGLPLAIELAAAQSKLLAPAALLKRLEHALPVLTNGPQDLDERQQTMRNTLAWSYALLSAEEQRLFRRLAVFAGGCTLEAAEAVCGAPDGAQPLRIDLFQGLYRLVDHHLLQQRDDATGARFSMLHIIREFASDMLAESGELAALQQAHAAHVVGWGSPTPAGFYVAGDRNWLLRAERETANIRAALAWAIEHQQVEMGLRLVIGFAPYWLSTGQYTEARRWLNEALAMTSSATPDASPKALLELRLWALSWDALLTQNQCDVPGFRILARELLEAAEPSGSVDSIAIAFSMAASAIALPPGDGDRERGLALYARSEALIRQSGNLEVKMRASGARLRFYYVSGMLDEAWALANELQEIALNQGWPAQVCYHHLLLGETAFAQGKIDIAREQALLGLRTGRAHGIIVRVGAFLGVLAAVAAKRGDYALTARLLGAESNRLEHLGITRSETVEHPSLLDAVNEARGALDGATWQAAFASGKALSLDAAIAFALGEDQPDGTPADR